MPQFIRRDHRKLRVSTGSAEPGGKTAIFVCQRCDARNRVPLERIPSGPVCGRCHTPLKTWKPSNELVEVITCGRCKYHLVIDDAAVAQKFVEPSTGWLRCSSCGDATVDEELTCRTPLRKTYSQNHRGERIVVRVEVVGAHAHVCAICQASAPLVVEMD